MDKSENINDLALALSLAQSEMKSAVMDCYNPHFKSKYASMTSIMAAIKEPLAKNGISVVQCVSGGTESSHYSLETTLFHKSGQWLRSSMNLIVEKQNMQSLGSALSYGRRQALSAMVGVVEDEEDTTRPEVKNPGEFVINFGEHKDNPKKIKDIPAESLQNFIDWANGRPKLPPNVKEALDNAVNFLMGKGEKSGSV